MKSTEVLVAEERFDRAHAAWRDAVQLRDAAWHDLQNAEAYQAYRAAAVAFDTAAAVYDAAKAALRVAEAEAKAEDLADQWASPLFRARRA